MGEKKSKALALDLIDELLNEDAAELEVEGKESQQKESSAPAKDDDHTVDLAANADKTEISDPEVAAPARVHVPVRDLSPDESTERINQSTLKHNVASGDPEDRVRASVGRFGTFRAGGQASTTEAALAQSESLRIAQQRLIDLEGEIERLRLQNEELAAAGETLRRRTDELLAQNQKRESDYENAVSTFNQEKELLSGSKEALQRDLEQQRRKAEELELRISTNIQKIRVRERELENRLELVKMESAALIRSKDEMILELKRNIDQLNLELNNYRAKNQELNRQTTDKQEMLRRTVKALRLALSMLEGEEEAPKASPQRKAK